MAKKLENRYLIYEILGHEVTGELSGVVEKVSPNIHTGKWEITVDSVKHSFDQPDRFLLTDDKFFFIYGDNIQEDDDESFDEVGSQDYRISADEYFSQNKEKISSSIVFNVGAKVSEAKDRWRKRQIFK